MDEAHLDATRWFFDGYRRRLLNVRALSTLPAPPGVPTRAQSFEVDQHILIGAGIDAMANDWARVFAPEWNRPGRSSPRMQEFLRENANSSRIFDRIAGPLLVDALVDAAIDVRPEDPVAADQTLRQAVAVRDVVNDRRSGNVRFAHDDPFYDEFLRDERILALRLDEITVRKARFGEVLYKAYRCPWLHEGRPSPLLAPSDVNGFPGWSDLDHVVRYQNIRLISDRPRDEANAVNNEYDRDPDDDSRNYKQPRARRRPAFSLPWLFAVYEEAIESFAERCAAEDRCPLPE